MILSKNLLHNVCTFSPLFIVSVFVTQFTCMYFFGLPLIPTACLSMAVCFLILNILYLITEFQKNSGTARDFITRFERASHTVLANNTARIRTQTQPHRVINPSRENSVVARIEENREIYQSRENIVNTRIEEICTDFLGRLGRGILIGNSNHTRLGSATDYNNDNARRITEEFIQSLAERQPFQIRQAVDDHSTNTLLNNPTYLIRTRLSQLRQAQLQYTSTPATVDANQASAHQRLINTINESYPEIHDKLCSPNLNLICPLTRELITDPVKADDGYTYERAQIAQWLNNNSTSPMTRVRMTRNLSQDSQYNRKLQQAFNKEQNEQIHQCKELIIELERNEPAIHEQLSNNPNYDLVCPITLNLIREPVRAEDGICYEKESIATWLSQHRNTSPLTRVRIGNKLTPDIAYFYKLKNAVTALRESNSLNP
ncbi:MAG: U-box domain-containing protein [Pseudomonadota bacterium]|nr:U-box domain-containing protein [Pseudomonadota bacterium]